MIDPFAALLAHQRFVVLDGGLATELEREGHDLAHPLWSARLLFDDEAAIAAVHRRFLDAGADCILTASYQASLPGLIALGHDEAAAARCITRSVTLAREVRDAFVAEGPGGAPRPLVAASVGPYGAFLADGSEYRGHYGLSRQQLRAFHEGRLGILDAAGPDLLACETLPSLDEAEVLAELLASTPTPGWLSFTCRDGDHLADGTPVERAAGLVQATSGVFAMGINCTSPADVAPLVARSRAAGLTKPVVVYPNSGEHYDAGHGAWHGAGQDVLPWVGAWLELGAVAIGGCCRTGPELTRRLRASTRQQEIED